MAQSMYAAPQILFNYPMNYFQYMQFFAPMFDQQPRQSKQQKSSDQHKKQRTNEQRTQRVVVAEKTAPAITGDMKNALGDELCDYISNLNLYDEDLTGELLAFFLNQLIIMILRRKLTPNLKNLKLPLMKSLKI